jgi:hypothetical protein
MNPLIYLLIALAVATTIGYFNGRKTNRLLGALIGATSEKVLDPSETEYVNIGGTLGYNFTFKLTDPFTEAKGTFTLLPRHSILYLPLSFLITRHDRLYLNIFTGKKLMGEGHIIDSAYFPKMRVDIKGIEKLKRDTGRAGRKEFILLTDNPHLEQKLRALLAETEGTEDLLHFCCYSDNRTFFIHAVPKVPSLEPLLAGIRGKLPGMIRQ